MKNSLLNDSRRISGIFPFLLSESKKWSRPKTRLNVEDLDPGPAMHLAAFLDLTDIVSQLLEDGAKADIEDCSCETPLLWAIDRCHDGVVNQLVIRDDVNLSAYHGDSTPLHRAIDTHSHTIVKALLASKSIDVIFRAVDTTLQGDKGGTLLSQAVFSGNTNATDLLMRDDVDPNAKNKQGGTPLIEARELGRMAIFQRLLAHHYVELDAEDLAGWTVLTHAARQRNPQIMNLLLARDHNGSSPENEWRETPLKVAVRHGVVNAV